MKNLFYATRTDKNGNLLITSYENEKNAIKYGGEGSKISETVKKVDISTTAAVVADGEDNPGYILRSLIKVDNTLPVNNSFVIFAKKNGHWLDLQLGFNTYGEANTVMKALTNSYEALLVVDQRVEREEPEQRSYDDAREFTGEI